MEPTGVNETGQFETGPGIILNSKASSYLKQSGKWASFLAIVGFVICSIILLSVIVLPIGSFTHSATLNIPSFVGLSLKGAYLALDMVYFFLSLHLYRFSKKVKTGIDDLNSDQFAYALGKLKSFFQLLGIMAIVFFSLSIILLFTPLIVNMLMKH